MAPAIAVMLWNYEESKVDLYKNEALKSSVDLELEKNHEFVENSGVSDASIVDSAAGKK